MNKSMSSGRSGRSAGRGAGGRGRRQRAPPSKLALYPLDEENDWVAVFEEEPPWQPPPEPIPSRNFDIIIEYKLFKAARTIQTAVRGWLARRRYARERRSIGVIQKWWRRYRAQRRYFRLLEETAQRRALRYYDDAATRLQALWRGWWARRHIHDHRKFVRMQIGAAQNLLYCVALKLHHLLRIKHLPGIYSLRNSKCLAKVEDLLAAMNFKQYNWRIKQAGAKRETKIAAGKKIHAESRFMTLLPYPGLDFLHVCEPICTTAQREERADKVMREILFKYRDALHEAASAYPWPKPRTPMKPSAFELRQQNFCEDLVHSMRRWQILQDEELALNARLFDNPVNVEGFLREVAVIYRQMNAECCVKRRHVDVCAEGVIH